jgi:hypothetical protein
MARSVFIRFLRRSIQPLPGHAGESLAHDLDRALLGAAVLGECHDLRMQRHACLVYSNALECLC